MCTLRDGGSNKAVLQKWRQRGAEQEVMARTVLVHRRALKF